MELELTLQELAERVSAAKTDAELDQYRGLSPGGAAQALGISRPSIYTALNKGALDSIRLLDDNGSTCTGLLITKASIEEYLTRRRRTASKKAG